MLAHERSQQYAGPTWAGPKDEKHRCAVSPAVSFRFRCRADAGQQQRVIGGRSGSADWSNRAGETRAVGGYKRAPARRSPQPVPVSQRRSRDRACQHEAPRHQQQGSPPVPTAGEG